MTPRGDMGDFEHDPLQRRLVTSRHLDCEHARGRELGRETRHLHGTRF